MKVLWALEEASVREIREQLAADSRPLAYTTVETIMDRLTRKGVVDRHKRGKAHRYTPVYQKADARAQAVTALVEHFFDGSRQALVAHLAGKPVATPRRTLRTLAAEAKLRRERRPTVVRRPPAATPPTGAAGPDTRPEAPIDTSLL
jgi:predicted transcriptional regulator